jgi:hypothetical protein
MDFFTPEMGRCAKPKASPKKIENQGLGLHFKVGKVHRFAREFGGHPKSLVLKNSPFYGSGNLLWIAR